MLLSRRRGVFIHTRTPIYPHHRPSSPLHGRATRCSILRVPSHIPTTTLLLVYPIPIHVSPYRLTHPAYISSPSRLLLVSLSSPSRLVTLPILIQLDPLPCHPSVPSRQLGLLGIALGDPSTTHAPLSGSKARRNLFTIRRGHPHITSSNIALGDPRHCSPSVVEQL